MAYVEPGAVVDIVQAIVTVVAPAIGATLIIPFALLRRGVMNLFSKKKNIPTDRILSKEEEVTNESY